ncbi:MAG TPA: metal-dependent transcriptional regulator [Candidatus Kapabacteria bacterium]|nr:metal-dependent transcriptional regulator [Candidatus Kapabacteria bacterium]
MFSQAVQDYLKTIYKLQMVEDVVSTSSIARELNVSGASVTGMLKKLANKNLADYNSYKGVRLTEMGVRNALEILRNHRLLELYLKDSLGFSLAKVHDEACRLEHYVSDEFIEKIDTLLGYPQYSPLGNPIPSKDGVVPDYTSESLVNVDLNKKYKIKRISDENNDMVDYFEKMGMLPGVDITLLTRAPFNGPMTIAYNNHEEVIGFEVARNIFVN